MVSDTTVDTANPFLYKFISLEEEYFRLAKTQGAVAERNHNITRRYFGIHCPAMNLPQVGDYYGISGERARQIKVRILERMHDTLLGSSRDLPLMQWPGGLVKAYRTFRKRVLRDKCIIVRSNLAEMSPEQEDTLVPYLNLLMGMLGFESASYRGCALYYDRAAFKQKTLFRLIYNVSIILSHEVYPMEASVIVDTFRRDYEHIFPGENVILDIINEIPDFEYVNVDGRSGYQMPLVKLTSTEFMAIRVLRDSGKPMYYRHVMREINRQLALHGMEREVPLETIQVQLCSSGHAEAISRTGKWGLVDWGMETDSLTHLIERTLRSSGKVMTLNEILDAVKVFRDNVRRHSVRMLLSTYKDIFVRLKCGGFALVEWGIASEPFQPVNRTYRIHGDAEVMKAIIRIVRRHDRHVFTRTWLKEKLKAEGYDFSENNFNTRVINFPILEVLRDSQSDVRLKANADSAMVDKILSVKEPFAARIARRIDEILAEQHGMARLVDLTKQVARETGCQRANVYQLVIKKGYRKSTVDGKTVILAASEPEK